MVDAYEPSPLLNEDCIRSALGGRGITLHYDLSAMLRAMTPEWRSVAANVVALSTITAPPTGAPPAMAGVYQVCQCVCIGVAPGEVPTLGAALERTTLYLRDVWNIMPQNIRTMAGHAEFIGPAVAGAALRNVTIADLITIVGYIVLNEAHATMTVRTVTTGILAYCKRGNVTINVVNKIATALQQERSMNINIDPDLVRQVWNICSTKVTAATIRAFLVVWENSTRGVSLRLNLIIQQAKWQGLTSYQMIIQAKGAHPGFFWPQLRLMVPQEFDNFATAHQQINGDPYYGYNADLGLVKSTNYPTLAYAATCLCKDVDGQRTLADYRGDHRNTPRARDVDILIRKYLDERRNLDYTPEQIAEANTELNEFRNIRLIDAHQPAAAAGPPNRRPPPPPPGAGGAGAGAAAVGGVAAGRFLVQPAAEEEVIQEDRPLRPVRPGPPADVNPDNADDEV